MTSTYENPRWADNTADLKAISPVVCREVVIQKGTSMQQPTQVVHMLLGINENGNIVNAWTGDRYMDAFDGKVFQIITDLNGVPKEFKNAVDSRSYIVYHSNTQRFTQIPAEKYREMKEL